MTRTLERVVREAREATKRAWAGSLFLPPRGTIDTVHASTGRASTGFLSVGARRERLPAEPLRIRHQLSEHPLFAIGRIQQTLRKMPAEQVEIRAVPEVGDARAFQRAERITDLDGARAFEMSAERPLWINLHHVERYDEEYRALLAAYLCELGNSVDELTPQVHEAGCFLLLSSGRASVHFHADPDQSFLNQIRGHKRAFVYPAAILPEEVLETLAHSGDHDAAVWRPEYEARAFPAVKLAPGDATLLPLYAPHRVENDDEPSVSLSIGFHTRHSLRRSRVHVVNRELRGMRLPVTPWGESALGDRLKQQLHVGMRIKSRLARA